MLSAAAHRLADLPELSTIQAYAGTAAPFNFNGLVRHYYLRDEPQQGDLQVSLAPKGERHRSSHEIALDVRNRLEGLQAPEAQPLRSSRYRRARPSFQRCWPRSTTRTATSAGRSRARCAPSSAPCPSSSAMT